jgi:tRNA1Val (adenine37-N6)-methyltransferase
MDNYFRFKQFQIAHDRCSMKVGTDAVLLGAWVDCHDSKKVLDIGTGSGVIALMLAQRTGTESKIDAIDVEPNDCKQAHENFSNSPWPNKLAIYCNDVREFTSMESYDLIVSNPPYFQNSWLPPSDKRKVSRHTQTLTHEELLLSAKRLLSSAGRLAIILPYAEGISFIEKAEKHSFHCIRQTNFRSRIEKPIERLLLEFAFQPLKKIEGDLIHYSLPEKWSDEYILLTKEFYTKNWD